MKTPNMSIISPISHKIKRKIFAKPIAKVAFLVYNKDTNKERKAASER